MGKNIYWRGGHRTYFLDGGNNWGGEKTYTGRGGHRTYFVDGGTIRVGIPQKIEKKYVNKPFRHLPDTFWNIIDTFQTYPDTFQTL